MSYVLIVSWGSSTSNTWSARSEIATTSYNMCWSWGIYSALAAKEFLFCAVFLPRQCTTPQLRNPAGFRNGQHFNRFPAGCGAMSKARLLWWWDDHIIGAFAQDWKDHAEKDWSIGCLRPNGQWVPWIFLDKYTSKHHKTFKQGWCGHAIQMTFMIRNRLKEDEIQGILSMTMLWKTAEA